MGSCHRVSISFFPDCYRDVSQFRQYRNLSNYLVILGAVAADVTIMKAPVVKGGNMLGGIVVKAVRRTGGSV